MSKWKERHGSEIKIYCAFVCNMLKQLFVNNHVQEFWESLARAFLVAPLVVGDLGREHCMLQTMYPGVESQWSQMWTDGGLVVESQWRGDGPILLGTVCMSGSQGTVVPSFREFHDSSV